jgi:hypothetical protein
VCVREWGVERYKERMGDRKCVFKSVGGRER